MEFDREERRYLFHTYASEIESTDIKFLYGVNKETRALVKRSTRADALKRSLILERCRRYRRWKLRGSIIRGVRYAVFRILRPKDGRTTVLLSSCSNE